MQGKRQFPRFRKNMIILCMTTILILSPSNIIPPAGQGGAQAVPNQAPQLALTPPPLHYLSLPPSPFNPLYLILFLHLFLLCVLFLFFFMILDFTYKEKSFPLVRKSKWLEYPDNITQ